MGGATTHCDMCGSPDAVEVAFAAPDGEDADEMVSVLCAECGGW